MTTMEYMTPVDTFPGSTVDAEWLTSTDELSLHRLRRRTARVAGSLFLFPILLALLIPLTSLADFSGKVVGVKDGDTIEVLKAGSNVTIRLNGIDCPEKAQAFGQRAKQATSDLVFKKTVKVVEKDKDRYGRTIGDVVLEDGRNLSHELVRTGMAWWYRQYAPKDKELEALETKARDGKVGLWRDRDPVPPWEWRKAGKETAG